MTLCVIHFPRLVLHIHGLLVSLSRTLSSFPVMIIDQRTAASSSVQQGRNDDVVIINGEYRKNKCGMRDVVRETRTSSCCAGDALPPPLMLQEEAKIMKRHQQHFLCSAIIQSSDTRSWQRFTVDNQINNQEIASSAPSIIHPERRAVFVSSSFLALDKCLYLSCST